MLIRSQDKKSIINLSQINGLNIFYAPNKQVYEIYYHLDNENDPVIAEYSTEEKAITVLDMIEKCYREYSSGNCNDFSVFQMPEDVIIVDEVGVND